MSIKHLIFTLLLNRRLLAIFVCILFILSLSAWSSNKANDTDIKITIGYQIPTSQTWGALIIKNQELFEKSLKEKYPNKNFNVEWFNSYAGIPLVNGMVSGKIDIAFLGDMPAIIAGNLSNNIDNLNAKIVAIDGRGDSGKNQSIIAPINGIDNISSLSGKKVSVPYGSSAHFMLLNTLKKEGLLDDVEIHHQSTVVGAQNIKTEKIDAVAAWEPYPTILSEQQKTGKIIAKGEDTNIDYLSAIVVNDEWIKKGNEELIVIFLNALNKSHELINENPRKASDIFQKETGFEEEITNKMVEEINFDMKIYKEDRNTFKKNMEFLFSIGEIDHLNITELIDDSYLKETLK